MRRVTSVRYSVSGEIAGMRELREIRERVQDIKTETDRDTQRDRLIVGQTEINATVTVW